MKVGADELVTGGDVGRRLGISRQRVGQLAATDGFPEPIGRLGRANVWRWADIAAWARAAGRVTRSEEER